MTVLENVMVSTFIRAPSLKIARRMAREILERVRLDDKADQQVASVTLEDRKRRGTRPCPGNQAFPSSSG